MTRLRDAWLVLSGRLKAARNLPVYDPNEPFEVDDDFLGPVGGARGAWLVLRGAAEAREYNPDQWRRITITFGYDDGQVWECTPSTGAHRRLGDAPDA